MPLLLGDFQVKLRNCMHAAILRNFVALFFPLLERCLFLCQFNSQSAWFITVESVYFKKAHHLLSFYRTELCKHLPQKSSFQLWHSNKVNFLLDWVFEPFSSLWKRVFSEFCKVGLNYLRLKLKLSSSVVWQFWRVQRHCFRHLFALS